MMRTTEVQTEAEAAAAAKMAKGWILIDPWLRLFGFRLFVS
jgi:hypothetical protein